MSEDLRKRLNIGDIVILRNGSCFVFNGKRFWSNNCYVNHDDYNEKLEFNNLRNKDLDIVEIKRPNKKELKDFGEKIENTIWKKENMWGNMTYAEAHKEMFMAIANGEVGCKKEWLDKTSPTPSYELENFCFACEEAKRRKEKDEENKTIVLGGKSLCSYCPLGDGIDWSSNGCLHGIFNKFIFAKGFEKFKAAYEIANLEWKEEE